MAPPTQTPPIRRKQALMRAVPYYERLSPESRQKFEDRKLIARQKREAAAPMSKKQRWQVEKREELMRKVREGGISKEKNGKGVKRRRPAKKLQAAEDMDGMRDALPELSGDEGEEGEWEGFSEDEEGANAGEKRKKRRIGGDGKIKMRSLKHRPGAMKRKRRMEGVEMERFGRNLAQLSANTKAGDDEVKDEVEGVEAGEDGGSGAQRKEKWAALRAFIGSTLERKAADSKS